MSISATIPSNITRRKSGPLNAAVTFQSRLAVTRDQTRRALTARADAASTLVRDCIAYVDTVSVLVRKPLSLSRLRRHNRGQVIAYKSRARDCGYAYGYRVQQPSVPTLEYISTCHPDHLVTRFDLAVDFIVGSADDQSALADFLKQHLTQPWRGKRDRTVYEGTLYFGPASTRRNVAVYLSRSKITGQPVVHLELRYSAAACRRRGVHRIGDLSALDIEACIRRDIKLTAICWRTADRAIDRLAAALMRKHAAD